MTPGYLPFAAPSFVFVCFGFFGVFAFLSIGWSSKMPWVPRFSHDRIVAARPTVRRMPAPWSGVIAARHP